MSPHRSWKLAFVSSFWGPWTPLGDFRPHFWGTSPLLSPRNKFLATPLIVKSFETAACMCVRATKRLVKVI